jgi:accessory Sec system glycosyltransferase GtfB
MINLFDNYGAKTQALHYSLKSSGFNQPTVVINDDGFLPDDTVSPYSFFSGYYSQRNKSRYFNEITVPRFAEIRGNNKNAVVYYLNNKIANINYFAPLAYRRIIQSVDWLRENGKKIQTDFYNRFGAFYAQTIFDENQNPLTTTYFDLDGHEIIIENNQTRNIILNFNNKKFVFKSKIDFTKFFLDQVNFDLDRIFYDSLSNPLFINFELEQNGDDVFFFNEEIKDTIPGNLNTLLNREDSRTKKVVVQNLDSYNKMQNIYKGNRKDIINFLGLIYDFKRENTASKNTLIITNSDQIDQIVLFATKMPNMQFYIAAITEMSGKLMVLDNFENIHLYPNIKMQTLDKLWNIVDYYLDINQGSEVLQATENSFLNNLLIFGFNQTKHDSGYALNELYFNNSDDQLIDKFIEVTSDSNKTKNLIDLQHKNANLATSDEYREVL